MEPAVPGVPVSSSGPVACGNSGSCGSGGDGGGYVTWYVHHWTGKLMKASDYGYKAWPFGRKK